MAMLRFARRQGISELLRLVVSVRDPAALYYADELPGPESTVVYTRSAPDGSRRRAGRLTADDLAGPRPIRCDRVRLRAWIETWNDDPKPFVWHKSAEQILERLADYCAAINQGANA